MRVWTHERPFAVALLALSLAWSAAAPSTARAGEGERPRLVVQLGHKGAKAAAVDLSPDGAMTATAGRDATVRVWDTATGRLLRTMDGGHGNRAKSVAFSPDGSTILSGHRDGAWRLWDVLSGRLIRRVSAYSGSIADVRFAAGGRRVVASSAGTWGVVDTWHVWNLDGSGYLKSKGKDLLMSPDGEFLLETAGPERRLLRVADGAQVATLGGDWANLRAFGISGDGGRAALSLWDKTVRIFEVGSGKALRKLETPAASVAMDGDGAHLVLGEDKRVRVLAADSGVERAVVSGHDRWVEHLSMSDTGLTLSASSADDRGVWALVWETASGKVVARLTEASGSGRKVRLDAALLSADGARALIATKTQIDVWDVAASRIMRRVVLDEADRTPRFRDQSAALAFGPSDTLLVGRNGLGGAKARVLVIGADGRIQRVGLDARNVHALHVDAATKTALVSTEAGVFSLDPLAGSVRQHLPAAGHHGAVFARRGGRLLASEAPGLSLFALDSATPLQRWGDPRVAEAVFGADGRDVLVSYRDGRLSWVPTSGGPARDLSRQPGGLADVQLSPDGARVMHLREGQHRLLDLAAGQDRPLTAAAGEEVRWAGFAGPSARVLIRQPTGAMTLRDVDGGIELASFPISDAALAEAQTRMMTAERRKPEAIARGHQTLLASRGQERLRQIYRLSSSLAAKLPAGVWHADVSPGQEALRVYEQDAEARWTVHHHDLSTGRRLLSLDVYSPVEHRKGFVRRGANAVAITDQGAVFAWSGGPRIALTGSRAPTPRGLSFSPDGKFLTVVGRGQGYSKRTKKPQFTMRMWDLEGSGSPVAGGYLDVHALEIASNKKGKPEYWVTQKTNVYIGDPLTGNAFWRIGTPGEGTDMLAIGPESERVLIARSRAVKAPKGGGRLGGLAYLERRTGKVLWRKDVLAENMVVSPNGRRVAVSVGSDAVVLDAETGGEVSRFSAHGPPRWKTKPEVTDLVTELAFSPDASTVLSGSTDYTARLWDAVTGVERHRLTGHTDFVRTVAFSNDGALAASGGDDATVRLWNATTGERVATCLGHTSSVQAVAFSPVGAVIGTASLDGSVRLWSIAGSSCKALAQLVDTGEGGWAVLDASGRFDADNGGDMEGLHWVYGRETFALGQLKDRYYEPRLLPKLLGRSKEPLRDVGDLAAPALPPRVEMLATPRGSAGVLKFRVSARADGGIGRLVVRLNGREVIRDARPRGAEDAGADTLEVAIDASKLPIVSGRENRFEIVAYNAAGYLAGAATRGGFEPPEDDEDDAAETVAPRFFGLVVGVSDYAGDQLDLRFAAADAEVFGDALTQGAKALFGADRVDVKVLSTRREESDQRPTARNVEAALKRFADAAAADDILLIYLAGHGAAEAGSSAEYYYLAQDATDQASLADPAVRARVAVSSGQLSAWMSAVPALKQVLILDTCHAGRAVELATADKAARVVPGSRERALQRMKERVGLHILAGSAADAVSYEASRFGHGVLTYSLLEGMRGAAIGSDETWNIGPLFEHATQSVPRLAAGIGGVQRPVVATPRGGGGSFEVGLATKGVRETIRLPSARPYLERVTLVDARLRDRLGLVALASGHLRTISEEKGAPFTFVDQPNLGEFGLTGRYTTGDGAITVSLVLYKGDDEVAATELSEGDAEALAASIAAWVKAATTK